MKWGFQSLLKIEKTSKKFYTILEDMSYVSARHGTITVPKGFKTNLASFSLWNLKLRGRTERPAALHDFLYSAKLFSRKVCDTIFLEALILEGEKKWKANVYYRLLRLFGASHYN